MEMQVAGLNSASFSAKLSLGGGLFHSSIFISTYLVHQADGINVDTNLLLELFG